MGDDCPASLRTYRDTITTMTERIEELTERRAALVELLERASTRAEPGCALTVPAAPDPT